MGSNMMSIVEQHLGDLVKFNIGVNNGKVDVVVVYEDEYDQNYEYSFKFDKQSKETYFGSNISRNMLYKLRSDRNVEFENSLVEQFCE